MVSTAAHWDKVWSRRAPDEVSWFQSVPELSLRLIASVIDDHSAPIVDVGGGASPLVDELLGRGHTDLTVLDIAEPPLARARDRLGSRADLVTWVVSDVTTWEVPRAWALWHDRAVFHFLVDEEDRRRYMAQLREGVAIGGHALVAGFGPDGPDQCSGLPVRRHGPDELAATFGPSFAPVTFEEERHVTPAGVEQAFLYGLFRRLAGA